MSTQPSEYCSDHAQNSNTIFGRSCIPAFISFTSKDESYQHLSGNCYLFSVSRITVNRWLIFAAGWCKAMRITSWPATVYVIDYDVTSMGSLPNLHALSAADRPPISRLFEAPRPVVRHHLVRGIWTISTALSRADKQRVVVISFWRFGSLPRHVVVISFRRFGYLPRHVRKELPLLAA